ncbi:unnamed protein product [Ectocarpus fasciculatus]
MAPVPVLGWALPFALIGHGVCFQLVASPFARIDHRGKTAGTAAGLRSKTSRLRHVREAATTVRPDSSESSGYEQAGGDKRGEAGEGGVEKGKSPVLMEYFIRHGVQSAEIVPAVESDYYTSGIEKAKGLVFVKTADGKPFAAVMREDLVADRGSMARHLRLTSRQVTLAKAPYVEEVTGFPVGTIPPLGHRTRVPTLVDAELLKYSTIVGGAGRRGFDSRLSVEDLLKATGASVIPLARPRSLGLTRTAGGGGGGPIAKAPMLSWYSSTASIPTGGFPSGAADAGGGYGSGGDANGGSSFGDGYPRYVAEDVHDEQGRPQAREDDVFEPSAAAAAAAAAERMEGVDLGISSGADITRRSSGGSSDGGGGLHVGGGGGGGDAAGAAAGAGAAGNPEVEARLLVISAAMHAVSAALSALSSLPESGGGGFQGGVTASNHGGGNLEGAAASAAVCDGSTSLGDGAIMGAGDPNANDCGERAQSHNGGVASAGAADVAAASEPPRSARNDASVAVKNGGTQHSRAESVVADQASPNSSGGEEGMRQGALAPAVTPTGVSGAVAAPEVGGAEAVVAAAGVYGRELARAAGTPTVDAIGGDVHLVATVAGKRSLTRLLHFVDLVPPATEATPVANQTCLVRKAWMVPGMNPDRPPTPVKVQLIMGKTLVDRLGQQEALVAMRGVKRGQLLYITGRPTPDTRKHHLDGSPTTDNNNNGDGGAKLETYDLVCCSVRMLEDAPLVEPELVGKGDEWMGGGDYLEMDLEESAVVYVDSAKRLKEMGEFLRKTLLDDPAIEGGAKPPSGGNRPQRPALAVDCEWRPARVAGTPANPVCLLQLAAGERTFVVDMLHVCRPKSAAAATTAIGETSSALTKREALLEEALGAVLGSPGVVKVGLGPKADFQSLIRSYPHMPCFRRVCGVVNLCHVASNASSLRGKPADEKASLSRLCNLVLGKPLDKSEQCSDWGNRPLSGRQKRYAALDARATLRVHRQLAPEVPPERMECLFNTFAYDQRADGMVSTQTLPSTQRSPVARGGATRQQGAGGSRGGRRMRKLRAGGSRQERMLRKQLLGVTMINVSGVPLDVEGLRDNWLGRALPGLTKEGAVRACIFPRGEMPTSGELPTVLRFDRHQSFVEFGNGYALLMNCGGPIDREHASGFLDESGTMAAWYLEGKLSSDAAFVDSEAAEYQRQQQDSLRQERQGTIATTTPPPSGGGGVAEIFTGRGVSSSSTGAGDAADGGGGGGGGGDAIGKFLQRLADASGTPSSMLGGLPEDDPPAFLETPPRGGGGPAAGVGAGGEGADQEEQQQHPPHLVLFARVKGRPFVYCGAVDCVAQEYVWSAGSSLGMVRFTLALREWHEAATAEVSAAAASRREEGAPRNSDGRGAAAAAPSAGGGGRSSPLGEMDAGVYGEGNSFAGLVEEGFRR